MAGTVGPVAPDARLLTRDGRPPTDDWTPEPPEASLADLLAALRNLPPPGTGAGDALALVVGDPAQIAAHALGQRGYAAVRLGLLGNPGTSETARKRGKVERPEPDPGFTPDLCGSVEDLPFRDGMFAVAVLLDALEHVFDDRRGLVEVARVLRPGGRILLRVPAAGALAGLDALNAYRYLHETSGRGSSPPEVDDVGWRRQYRRAELVSLLGALPFDGCRVTRGGLGLSEVAYLAALIRNRWRRDRPAAARAARRRYLAATLAEDRLPGTRYLLVTAERR